MRILHLDTGKAMRGGQRQALHLIEGLSAAGVEATLLGGAGLQPAPSINLWRVARLARRHDLVHAHDSRSHTLAALAGGAPLVVSRRVAFGGAGSRPARPNWKYRRAAHYIAVSEFVKEALVRRGIPREKITVVYDGVPLLAQAAGSACLAPASADPQKGAALAREAARIAGIDLRFSDNLERDLASASLFLYISYSEGLGSGALLAMSAGVPVIASKIGGLPEIVHHRENGLLVENRPEAIAAAIRELAGDPGLARRLGEAGRRLVADRFTVAHMVRRTMEVYRKTLSCS